MHELQPLQAERNGNLLKEDGRHGDGPQSQMMTMSAVQALLSNAFAWMRKASEDGLDGMVALLQKVCVSITTLSSSPHMH